MIGMAGIESNVVFDTICDQDSLVGIQVETDVGRHTKGMMAYDKLAFFLSGRINNFFADIVTE